jgi:hypothetical protein
LSREFTQLFERHRCKEGCTHDHGRLLLRYQTFREINPPILYLTGETDRTLLALGGALKHARLSVVAKAPDDATAAVFDLTWQRTSHNPEVSGGLGNAALSTELWGRGGRVALRAASLRRAISSR